MLTDYYSRRAEEYEEIYRRPDAIAQAELSTTASLLQELVRDRYVLEIACGTGYWTQHAARAARRITALDASQEMLDCAAAKSLPLDRVRFALADAYDLEAVDGEFDAAIAFFWISHVPAASMDQFLHGLCARLLPGARLLLADNVYVPGLGGDLVRVPGERDTYKMRTLADGSVHRVLKNYFEADQLVELLKPWASQTSIEVGKRYWWAACVTR